MATKSKEFELILVSRETYEKAWPVHLERAYVLIKDYEDRMVPHRTFDSKEQAAAYVADKFPDFGLIQPKKKGSNPRYRREIAI
jgi:hypothetical protein